MTPLTRSIGTSVTLLACVFAAFLFAHVQTSHGQVTGSAVASGTIRDAVTGQPVESANVFLASTTIGTASDKEGKFRLAGIPAGRYQIVFSCVGYRTSVRVLDQEALHPHVYDVRLEPREISMPEVEISAEVDDDMRKEYKHNLERFLEEFLGERSNAELCRVINPQDITVWVSDDTLHASASNLLEVENRALGYTLRVALQSFVCPLSQDAVRFTVYPQFIAALARNADEADEWRLNRRDTYRGSLTHFLSALVNREINKQGFQVRGWRGKGEEGFVVNTNRLDVMPVVGSRYVIWKQQGWLVVRYFRDNVWETSFIRINGDAALVEASGSLRDPMMVTVAGAWAQYRVSDMLPLNMEADSTTEAKDKSRE